LDIYHPDTTLTLTRICGCVTIFRRQQGSASKKVWEALTYRKILRHRNSEYESLPAQKTSVLYLLACTYTLYIYICRHVNCTLQSSI